MEETEAKAVHRPEVRSPLGCLYHGAAPIADFAKSASVGLDRNFAECPELVQRQRRQGARSRG